MASNCDVNSYLFPCHLLWESIFACNYSSFRHLQPTHSLARSSRTGHLNGNLFCTDWEKRVPSDVAW